MAEKNINLTIERPAFKGTHLMIDGLVKNSEVFSKENIEKLFLELVQTLDMKIILGPLFKEVELDEKKLNYNAFADTGGISAFCMISTSHIAIHYFELTKTFQMDIFSCKWFDAEKAFNVVNNILEIQEFKNQVVERTQLDYT